MFTKSNKIFLYCLKSNMIFIFQLLKKYQGSFRIKNLILFLSLLLVSIGQRSGTITVVEKAVLGIKRNITANTGFLIFCPDNHKTAYLLPQAVFYCMIPRNFDIWNAPSSLQYQGFDILVTSASSNITLSAENSFSIEETSTYYFF